MTGNLYEDKVFFFLIKSRFNFLRVRNVANKGCRENQNIFLFKNFSSKIVLFMR